MADKKPSELEKVQKEEANPGFLKDFFYFLLHNKKWWLAPILIILLILSLLMLLSTTAAAPFIYTLFKPFGLAFAWRLARAKLPVAELQDLRIFCLRKCPGAGMITVIQHVSPL